LFLGKGREPLRRPRFRFDLQNIVKFVAKPAQCDAQGELDDPRLREMAGQPRKQRLGPPIWPLGRDDSVFDDEPVDLVDLGGCPRQSSSRWTPVGDALSIARNGL
jgi:hypothetical protein